ncbi:hypothetical protein jaqu_06670 [Jannaschia aquimarina]|uniref:DUF1800 domain-containing protein n=2 Tax=Jannaschia aquimarina TaxID=935700 RepID=A0A0D1EIM4_9RHOB|nr:hypothetical protein jaqu_06670 [Jannaschia aquimarina]SNS74989.1 Uncharacterized conserved protein, DUF1800 family [Jannaschia aquimarina]
MHSALAAIRFGTGLSPRIPAPDGPGDVIAQLEGPDRALEAFPALAWSEAAAEARDWSRLRRARRDGPAEREAYTQHNRHIAERNANEVGDIIARGAVTDQPFRERLAWFWADHFTVTPGRGYLRASVPSYQAELRPHLSGRFADLLEAAVTHPAMVIYLDQSRSVGPNSQKARNRYGGLNENLAREVLELHTLGVGAGYKQADVTELAELLTGLTVNRDGSPAFNPKAAEPGPETVLGRTYGGDPAAPDDLRAVLRDLARHPDTAWHLSGKLARHFVSDRPDRGLVDAMAAKWLATDGDLRAVYSAMLDHPAAWSERLEKVRRPVEYLTAAFRALDVPVPRGRRLTNAILRGPLNLMGQSLPGAPAPDGWPEEAEAWITPQALAARIEWSMRAPVRMQSQPQPRDVLQTALGPLASGRTRFAVEAAETAEAAIGLVLASPEFQRR